MIYGRRPMIRYFLSFWDCSIGYILDKISTTYNAVTKGNY